MNDQDATAGRPASLGRRLGAFAALNLLAAALAAGAYAFVLHLDGASSLFGTALDVFFRHETALVVAAGAPLGAALLVGWGYRQRAQRRTARQLAGEAARGT